jgi:hypothetical protein
VRTLPRPQRDHVRQHLVTALEVQEVNGQQRGYPASAADLDAIIALYDSYDATGGAPIDPLKGENLDAALRLAIQVGYDLTQRGRRLSAIRAHLMQGIEQCPICGIGPPRELDHYLPRSTFHPLAIYVRNLVPLCGECNHSKGAAAATEPAQRFVHPYFEEFPDQRFLQATVTLEAGGLVVEFEIDPAVVLHELLRERLRHQLQRLHLNERYAREVNAHVSNHTTALHWCFESSGAEGVRRFLNVQGKVEFARFHRNHWRPVLLVALSEHDAFCEGAFRDVLPPMQAAALPLMPEVVVPA